MSIFARLFGLSESHHLLTKFSSIKLGEEKARTPIEEALERTSLWRVSVNPHNKGDLAGTAGTPDGRLRKHATCHRTRNLVPICEKSCEKQMIAAKIVSVLGEI